MRISDWSSDVCSSDLRIVHMKLVSGEIFRPSIGIIVDDHGIGDGGGGIEMMAEDEVPKAHLARHVADQRGQYLQIASVPGQLCKMMRIREPTHLEIGRAHV